MKIRSGFVSTAVQVLFDINNQAIKYNPMMHFLKE